MRARGSAFDWKLLHGVFDDGGKDVPLSPLKSRALQKCIGFRVPVQKEIRWEV